MDWGMVINVVGSALGFGVAAFIIATFAAGLPTKASLTAGLAAGVSGFVAHLRQSPLRMVAALALLGLLAGCATLQSEVSKIEADFSKATLADVDQAIAMAQTAPDAGAPYRLRCYQTLRKYVPDVTSTTAAPLLPKGVVSGFEKAAELDATVRAGVGSIPADLHADCAVVTENILEFAARVGIKTGAVAIPGGALLQGILPVR